MMSSPGHGPVFRAVCSGGGDGGDRDVVRDGVGAERSARRCLFGGLDHEEFRRDYTQVMKEELEEASRRWSFDFTTHKPWVSGDFEWVEIHEDKVPFLYCGCTIGMEPRAKRVGPESNLKEVESTSNTPESCDLNTHCADKRTVKRRQTNITDFYQAKRRVITTRKSGQ